MTTFMGMKQLHSLHISVAGSNESQVLQMSSLWFSNSTDTIHVGLLSGSYFCLIVFCPYSLVMITEPVPLLLLVSATGLLPAL